VTVEGKQEQSTTGDHISRVGGTHSLEVKGDLARKVSGALGIKVDGDIVLESSSQISLKVGASFVVIQAGGVDIVGPKITLNGGGSAGTPVSVMQPGVLKALEDDNNNTESDNNTEPDNNTIPEQYNNEDGDAPAKSVCKECLKKAQEAAAAFAPRG
ncbi:hypothetical protein CHU33_03830, partial [Superficieibacter electus]